MIDWWLFFASNILVVTMAFHTYLAFLCETAKVGKDNTDGKSFWIPRLNFLKKRDERPSRHNLSKDQNMDEEEDANIKETGSLNNVKNEPKHDKMSAAIQQARRFNDFAKVFYLAIVVTFNIIFWVIAITEYSRPASYYLGESVNKTTEASNTTTTTPGTTTTTTTATPDTTTSNTNE